MLSFTYTARNTKTGEKVTAEIEAEDEKSATKLLIDRGLAPLEITPKAGKIQNIFARKKVTTKQRVVFSRQLSTLLNAGLPLVQSLSTVRSQTSEKLLNQMISEVIADVEAGTTLADSLAKFPDTFDDVYISLVAAGEASGNLDTSLERLANQQEKDSEIISKVRGALIYPAIVLVVLLAVVIFMMTTVLPQVQALYKSLPGVHLPFITVWLIAIAHFIISFWWLLILVLIAAAVALRRYSRTPNGKHFFDHLKLTMWPIGPMFSKLYMARFARTASTLVASGVPMIKMLQTTSQAVGNSLVANSINRAVEDVKAGKALSESLTGDPNILELVPEMIHVGEQSGALDEMLGKVADYYEKEVDGQIKTVSTIIEPVMMIVVGIMALIVVAAVLLPIYSLAGKNLGV